MLETFVVDMIENDQMKIEVLAYKELKGVRSPGEAMNLFYLEKAGVKAKMVKVTMKQGALKVESGALYYMNGNIAMEVPVKKGFMANLGTNLLTGEAMFKPIYRGTGEIYLEPSLGHFLLVELDNDELVVDKGLFYGCSEAINVTVVAQKSIGAALAGGEGVFQTSLKGTGLVILTIPVPADELDVIELDGKNKLSVDGNFAVARRGNVTLSVELAGGGLKNSVTSGEGFLQVFTGVGEVWLAPTQKMYHLMALAGMPTV